MQCYDAKNQHIIHAMSQRRSLMNNSNISDTAARKNPVPVSLPTHLVVREARTHNLQAVSLSIPHRALVVFTGVSGSGKSSLAFDTIYSECHRMALQSVSTYARQFLHQVEKPDVTGMEGLCSAVAIDQEIVARNPRSTIGTATDAYDILRVLFAHIGTAECPECGAVIKPTQQSGGVCPRHPQAALPEFASRAFSFNLPFGVCKACSGLGTQMKVDLHLVVPDPELSLARNALHPFTLDRWANVHLDVVRALAKQLNVSPDMPWKDLPESAKSIFLDGEQINVTMKRPQNEETFTTQYEGVRRWVYRQHRDAASEAAREKMEAFMRIAPCPECGGGRLNRLQLSVRIAGLNIAEVAALSVDQSASWARVLKLSAEDKQVAAPLLPELLSRLDGICDVGLHYLTLDRAMITLSGGEVQRIKLATQLCTPLFGMLYVFDEPTTGLHPRDNEMLLSALFRLRNQGNTILVVEHDLDVIREADWIVEVGPGAGSKGGHIVYSGPASELLSGKSATLTGNYLRGEKQLALVNRRRSEQGSLCIRGASARNLKKINVTIPLGHLVTVTGVSGSGKSTLVSQVLLRALEEHLETGSTIADGCDGIDGLDMIDRVVQIDQSPIGRTPRSNAATYTGAFDAIRAVFAQTPEARKRNYKAGRFSSNVSGGRCENCAGDGVLRIPMQFLADVYVPCDQCQGSGYLAETLEIRYREKSIAEVLEMSVADALQLFHGHPKIEGPLRMLADVGLDYLHLGQPATTLSGGEAQRMKLASELHRSYSGHCLYLLDEPSRGLHAHDLNQLLGVLNRLVEQQHTVLLVEHNLDLIRCADWIIDLGPEGGEAGGFLVAEGTPEEVAATKSSYTGKALKRMMM